MDNKARNLVSRSFSREEGSPLPTHIYNLRTLPSKRLSTIDLSDVIQAINTKERESKEEAVTSINLGKYLLT